MVILTSTSPCAANFLLQCPDITTFHFRRLKTRIKMLVKLLSFNYCWIAVDKQKMETGHIFPDI